MFILGIFNELHLHTSPLVAMAEVSLGRCLSASAPHTPRHAKLDSLEQCRLVVDLERAWLWPDVTPTGLKCSGGWLRRVHDRSPGHPANPQTKAHRAMRCIKVHEVSNEKRSLPQ